MMADTKNSAPPPGSKEARRLGCTCPVIDNCYGRGYMGQSGVFIVNGGCPIHAKELIKNS